MPLQRRELLTAYWLKWLPNKSEMRCGFKGANNIAKSYEVNIVDRHAGMMITIVCFNL